MPSPETFPQGRLTVASIQSNNPAFSDTIFGAWDRADSRSDVMTVRGTAAKAMALLVILVACAVVTWQQIDDQGLSQGVLIGSLVGGLVFAIATIMNKRWAGFTAPLYAACEGVLLGSISNMVASNPKFAGIVPQAIGLTFATTALMLFVYATGMIKVTGRFAAGVCAATGALALFYLGSMIFGAFGANAGLNAINSAEPAGHRDQHLRRRPGLVQPAAGLRHDRAGRELRRAEVHGVVRRVRPDGHAGLAVPGNPPPPPEAPEPPLSRAERLRSQPSTPRASPSKGARGVVDFQAAGSKRQSLESTIFWVWAFLPAHEPVPLGLDLLGRLDRDPALVHVHVLGRVEVRAAIEDEHELIGRRRLGVELRAAAGCPWRR